MRCFLFASSQTIRDTVPVYTKSQYGSTFTISRYERSGRDQLHLLTASAGIRPQFVQYLGIAPQQFAQIGKRLIASLALGRRTGVSAVDHPALARKVLRLNGELDDHGGNELFSRRPSTVLCEIGGRKVPIKSSKGTAVLRRQRNWTGRRG